MADNAQQKTVVLGDPVALGDLALDAVAATVRINGETVATGRGDAVLGNPLNSVVWLARKLQEFGRGIEAGEIIMSGSFTRQFPIAPGDRVEVDFAGVGGGADGDAGVEQSSEARALSLRSPRPAGGRRPALRATYDSRTGARPPSSILFL